MDNAIWPTVAEGNNQRQAFQVATGRPNWTDSPISFGWNRQQDRQQPAATEPADQPTRAADGSAEATKEKSKISKEVLLDLHRRMVRIRLLEEAAGRLASEAKIPGFIHLYVGEEAVAAGGCGAGGWSSSFLFGSLLW